MRLVIHPIFILFIVITLLLGWGFYVMAAVSAVLIHEFSHAIVANYYGVKAKKLTLLPFGASVTIDCSFLPIKHQRYILLAGAGGNFIVAMVAGSLLWLFPTLFSFLSMFIVANVGTAILNLLPIYPLDGGKLIKVPKIIPNIVFGVLFFLGCFVWFNLALLIFSTAMLLTINMNSGDEFTSRFAKKLAKKDGPVHEIAVRKDMTIFAVYKLVSTKYFTKFVITDMANKVFYENELESFLVTYEIDTRLLDIYI